MNNKEIVLFYNVENLFDVVDNPKTFDDEFTPQGDKNWTETKYNNKIHKITSVFKEIAEKEQVMPFAIGVTEVENAKVVADLTAELPNFRFIHYDSKDERGIDVAFLYDSHKLLVTHHEKIFVELENPDGSEDFTRDILHVSGIYQNKNIHFFVIHFPSKRNNDVNKPKRKLAAEKLREKMDEVFASEKDAAIVVMGDFNDNPKTDLLKDTIQFSAEKDLQISTDLYNPFVKMFENREFSLFYKDIGMLFDQIYSSRYLLKNESVLSYSHSKVFNDELVKEWNEKYKGQPFRTYVGRKYLGGYSDHFPVYSVFNE